MALLEYKCPCCAGKLEFDSSLQKVKCPFCDSEFEMSMFEQLDEALDSQVEENLDWQTSTVDTWGVDEGMKSYSCKSCGAQIVMDETTAAGKCPYCDNPIVMTGNLSGDLKPEMIIPFKLDKKAAKEAFTRHLTGKKLLPKVFSDQNHIDEIKGVYVPYWIFDSKAEASIKYNCTTVKSFNQGDTRITETQHYVAVRSGSLEFQNIPVDASRKMDDKLTESLEPFDLSQAVPFKTAYMAGYMADKYDVTAEDDTERVNNRVKNSTIRSFKDTVTGYSSVDIENSNVSLKNGTARYALLPVWVLNTSWNGNNYIFAMNGQTGKFVGDLPCDESLKKKISWGTGVAVAVATFAVGLLLHFLG
ncbi:MAG: hypothetical protein K6E62_07185 [Lachnospiraceae bacterium]|nr:hypothetical protein [Lachnospiraceae bacterium]